MHCVQILARTILLGLFLVHGLKITVLKDVVLAVDAPFYAPILLRHIMLALLDSLLVN